MKKHQSHILLTDIKYIEDDKNIESYRLTIQCKDCNEMIFEDDETTEKYLLDILHNK